MSELTGIIISPTLPSGKTTLFPLPTPFYVLQKKWQLCKRYFRMTEAILNKEIVWIVAYKSAEACVALKRRAEYFKKKLYIVLGCLTKLIQVDERHWQYKNDIRDSRKSAADTRSRIFNGEKPPTYLLLSKRAGNVSRSCKMLVYEL